MSSDPLADSPVRPLLVAPILVVTATVLLAISNAMVYVGPFDRATFGWLVPIPMLLVAPGIAGLAARWSGYRPAALAIGLVGVCLGLLLTGLLVATVDRLGCEPAADKVRVLGYVAPAGLLFGAAFAFAGLVALRLRARPVVAVILGAVSLLGGWFLTIIAGGLLFQGVSCAYVP